VHPVPVRMALRRPGESAPLVAIPRLPRSGTLTTEFLVECSNICTSRQMPCLVGLLNYPTCRATLIMSPCGDNRNVP
jgi:hypothetical protein